MSALFKWMQTPQAERIGKAAEKKAWKTFNERYPLADKSQFEPQTLFAKDHTATSEIYYKAAPGYLINVLRSYTKNWSPEMKRALGVDTTPSEDFPKELKRRTDTSKELPIPAVPFDESAASLKKIFNNPLKIYVSPDQYFETKFREIFKQTKLTHRTAKESKAWLAGPHMKYWPQQLNFAVWCATTGCGISREIFEDGSRLWIPENVRAFYRFHVYFTVRRILYEMGGIEKINAMPDDPVFNKMDNKYVEAAYKRICDEFGIPHSSDFRFTAGKNHGLGSVYIYVTNIGPDKTSISYPGYDKFSDEGGSASKGNLIYYIEPDDAAYSQADWFCPNAAQGLTRAGLLRINASIEAFVYCVLGAQVNIRSSIIGEGGRAMEAQQEFKQLVEDAIKNTNMAQSVARYQLAIEEAKVRLNMAVCLGAWLMPGRMIINTESTVGYNNNLKQATQEMKLGINDGINTGTKKVGVTPMAGGPTKIDLPQRGAEPTKTTPGGAAPSKSAKPEPEPEPEPTEPPEPEETPPSPGALTAHEKNIGYLIAGFAVLGGLAYLIMKEM